MRLWYVMLLPERTAGFEKKLHNKKNLSLIKLFAEDFINTENFYHCLVYNEIFISIKIEKRNVCNNDFNYIAELFRRVVYVTM